MSSSNLKFHFPSSNLTPKPIKSETIKEKPQLNRKPPLQISLPKKTKWIQIRRLLHWRRSTTEDSGRGRGAISPPRSVTQTSVLHAQPTTPPRCAPTPYRSSPGPATLHSAPPSRVPPRRILLLWFVSVGWNGGTSEVKTEDVLCVGGFCWYDLWL